MDDEQLLVLFEEFKEEFDQGLAPDVEHYISRAGEYGPALWTCIEEYLMVAPPPPLAPEVLARPIEDPRVVALLSKARGPAAERPEAVEPAHWARLLDRLREWAVETFVPRFASPVSILDAELPQRGFGKGVSLSAIEGQPDRSRLRLVARHIGELGDGPVLVLVQDEEGEILAEHLFETVGKEATADLDLDPRQATADGVLVLLAAVLTPSS